MEEIIKIESLTKDYGKNRGIFDLNLSIRRGEIYGLIGTNGSGKTTTLRNLMGFIKPNIGKVSILGKDCYEKADELKPYIGYVPGQISFPDVGTGKNFLKIQAEALGIKDFTRLNYLLDLFKLDADAELKRMSKGMKQKTALVAAFMADPEIYLLDEPTTGLDPLMVDNFIELILEEKAKGKTIFMSSHIFKELENTCDRAAIIHKGKIVQVIDRNMHYDDYKQPYTFEFETEKDYLTFKNLIYEITREKTDILQLTVSVYKKDLQTFMKDISNFKIKYLEHKPYTLSCYFDLLFANQEENKNV